MYKSYFKFNFSSLNNIDFLVKAECIVKCTETADFPPHMPRTAEMKKALDAYKISLEKNSAVDKSIVEARTTLEKLFLRLPAFCEFSAIDKMVQGCGIASNAA